MKIIEAIVIQGLILLCVMSLVIWYISYYRPRKRRDQAAREFEEMISEEELDKVEFWAPYYKRVVRYSECHDFSLDTFPGGKAALCERALIHQRLRVTSLEVQVLQRGEKNGETKTEIAIKVQKRIRLETARTDLAYLEVELRKIETSKKRGLQSGYLHMGP